MRDWHNEYLQRENDCGEDLYRKYTTYSSKAEADYYESGEYDLEMERREEAREMRDSAIREFFMDGLEIPRDSGCRDCAWMREVLDEYSDLADDDGCMPEDIYDLARRMCAECKAHTPAERDTALRDFFEKEEAQ